MQILRAAGHFAVPEGAPDQYREHLRAADLSVGTCRIAVGGQDGQEPPTPEHEVGPGTVVHVPAREPYHFTDVPDDLSIVVVSPRGARTGRRPPP